jgi:hypothetical protein
VKVALRDAGVDGADDFGVFVNNTKYFAPSRFDARAATPVLLSLLPSLEEPKTVAAVARHLRTHADDASFEVLLSAFDKWSEQEPGGDAAWALGDAVAGAATEEHVPKLLDRVKQPRLGASRKMIVDALWRWKRDDRVAPVLLQLLDDRSVHLHAMSALRRTIGNGAALPHLRHVRDTHPDSLVRKNAMTAVQRAEKAVRSAGQV